jgi:hypothetical protein
MALDAGGIEEFLAVCLGGHEMREGEQKQWD